MTWNVCTDIFGLYHGLLNHVNVTAQRYCVDVRGLSYSGKVSVTQQNIPCQRWDSQHPHAHGYTDSSMFPDTTLADAANYCRVLDGNGLPWCYTTSAEQPWDYCDFDTIYWGMYGKILNNMKWFHFSTSYVTISLHIQDGTCPYILNSSPNIFCFCFLCLSQQTLCWSCTSFSRPRTFVLIVE